MRNCINCCKRFLTKYPIIFSFTKKCYWILLDVFEDEVAYLICEFIKENTPKKYIHWNYGEFKFKKNLILVGVQVKELKE